MRKTDSDLHALPADLCPHFRTKTMFLNLEHRRSAEETRAQSATAHFWCAITMGVHGPDDDDVLPGCCVRGRSCHEGGDPT